MAFDKFLTFVIQQKKIASNNKSEKNKNKNVNWVDFNFEDIVSLGIL